MHSPDVKPRKKATNLADKKTQLSLHLFKGSLMVSPKSTCQTSASATSRSDIKTANRFDLHSLSKSKSKPHLEHQILHEAKTSRYPKFNGLNTDYGFGDSSQNMNALLSPRYKKSNPITQSGDEPVQEWKATSKKTAHSHRMAMFTEEEKPRGLARGQFHDVTRSPDRHEPTKTGGVKTFGFGVATQSSPPEEKRQLRVGVHSPDRNRPNPITVGEEQFIKQRPFEQQVSAWTQKSAEKKAFLPSERQLHSPKRPDFQKPTAIKGIINQDPLARRVSSIELSSELQRRKSGTIGQLFDHQHQNDSKFKTAPKVSEVEYKTIKSNLNTEKTFARMYSDINY